ncbi:MAG TPA: hypothetical protein P5027_04135 [Flavobacteriales bacterium]|nr:hypothetical protein [Flavobacteriales bacterium]
MKHLVIAGALLLGALPAQACDVCGLFLGVQPHDRTSSFGLFYRYRLLEGDIASPALAPGLRLLKHGGHSEAPAGTVERYRELYQVMELRADLWLGERWNVMVQLPLVNNYQSINGYSSADLYGMSDPVVLGRYLVANTKCGPDEDRTVHRFMLGGGVKLPLGRHDLDYRGEAVAPDLQPGSGSWDGLATAEYIVRRGSFGGMVNTIGRFNGADDQGYARGHGLSSTAELFLVREGKKLSWAPSVGAYSEWLAHDRQDGEELAGTGGSTVFAHVGSRVWWRSWVLTLYYQRAISSSMGELMVPNRERLITGIAYNLKTCTNVKPTP